jgi:cysteinyl-tRNA synthetase
MRPLTPGQVKIYVCGPTVYDEPHVGHARSAVVFDVVRRFLQAQGFHVTLVRNITDIDDKILEKARCRHQDFKALGARYLRHYQEAMHRLNIVSPDAEPKASEYISRIRDFISRLIQKGNAYAASGSVYFDVASFRHYGELSGRIVSGDWNDKRCHGTGKKKPADFALWKAAKPPDPVWPSPWGPGRPGWHIECSAMSTHLLGPVFDIHGGGSDLIFPHHENEIAQSQCLFESPPANIWMHHGLVHVNGRKVSKSQGGYATLAQLLDCYPADALRLVLLSKRYRHPLDFSHRRMQAGSAAMARMHGFFLRLNPEIWTGGDRQCGSSDRWSRFCSAMADDFNFPKALSIVFEGIRAIQRSMNSRPGTSGRPCNTAERSAVSELYTMCHDILGFHLGHSFHAEAGSTAKMAMVSTLRSDSKSIHLN